MLHFGTKFGEFIYENDTLRFINHEEGRILPDTSSTAQHPWEYQYHLKDHLGNVRVTFSEKTTTDQYLATMEKDPSTIDTQENNMFLNMVSSKKIAFYNHTPNAQTGYSYRLSASSTELIGPAKSFEVNSGDVVDLEVYVRYANLTTTNSGLSNLFNSLVGAFSLNPGGGIGLEGQQAYNAFNGMFGSGAFIGSGDWDENAPKAYLNYILFDEDFNLIDFGFDQLSQSAGSAHELLSLHVKVQQKGYLYIYLSNENDKIVDVYFDDFKIVYHTAVEQRDDYYPFGLTFNSYQRENTTANQFLYNGKEKQNALDIGWYNYGWRMYQPEIGRWNGIDGMAEKYISSSPYHYVANNPIRNFDIDGNEFTEAGKKWAKKLWNSISDQIGKNNKKIAKKNEMLATGYNSKGKQLSQGKMNRLETQVGRLHGNNAELTQAANEIIAMDNSDQLYNVVESSSKSFVGDNSNPDKAATIYNTSTGAVDIILPSSGGNRLGLLSHEFKHGYQFETGEMSLPTYNGDYSNFSPNGVRDWLAYDQQDEIIAYKRQGLFGSTKSSLPSLYTNRTIGRTAFPTESRNMNIYRNSSHAVLQHVANTSRQAFRVNGTTYAPNN